MTEQPENPALLIRILENCTLGAVTLILISGMIWGGGFVALFLSHAACIGGIK